MKSPLGWGEPGFGQTRATEAIREHQGYGFFKRTDKRAGDLCGYRNGRFSKSRVRTSNQGPEQGQGPSTVAGCRARAVECRAGEQGIEPRGIRSGRAAAPSRSGKIQWGFPWIERQAADLRPPGRGRRRFGVQNTHSGRSQRLRQSDQISTRCSPAQRLKNGCLEGLGAYCCRAATGCL